MHPRLTTRVAAQSEGAVQVLVGLLVVWVALASSNIPVLNIPIARAVRWAVLVELAAFAVIFALLSRKTRPARGMLVLAAVFVVVALVSAAWSVDGSLTVGRALSLVLLFATAFAIAHGTAGLERAVAPILIAMLAAIAGLALAGAIELFVRPDLARVPATTGTPLRFNGLGGNPNTMAMLAALGVPLAVWAYATFTRRAIRIVCAAVLVLLYVSIVASGSRGALTAGIVGGFVTAIAIARPARRTFAALAAASALLMLGGFVLMQVPAPAATNPIISNRIIPPTQVPLSPLEAHRLLPLENEIGFPRPGQAQRKRRLWDSSGRADAWRGAVELAADRPVVGYGFGTEEKTFVDRYYFHYSNRVENSFLGTLLQLGVVGLASFLLLLGAALVAAWRAVRRSSGRLRNAAGACAGVLVAGVFLAFGQSYLTSVGSPATAPFWLSVFLVAAIAANSGGELREHQRDEREEEPAQRHPEPRFDVVRAEDGGVHEQRDDDRARRAAASKRER